MLFARAVPTAESSDLSGCMLAEAMASTGRSAARTIWITISACFFRSDSSRSALACFRTFSGLLVKVLLDNVVGMPVDAIGAVDPKQAAVEVD